MRIPDFHITNNWVQSRKGPKNKVDPSKPYAFLVENERTAEGKIEGVATIFLTNRECPFRCLMCDLWKNTTDETVPVGAIPGQIEFALERMPATKHIKLYNSGNFFDKKAIPVQDYDKIIDLIGGFDTVLIENHPKLINREVVQFRDKLKSNLQVAIGLETVHPDILPILNKQMTPDDFGSSVRFLKEHDIFSRAFILLGLPFLNERESVVWAKRSVEFAVDAGVECSVIIPTRPGNGAIDFLKQQGSFQSPKIKSLESVLEYGISFNKGRVFADLWDLEKFSECSECIGKRKERLNRMNVGQRIIPSVSCSCDIA
ncbi:MAG: radical SAM protein [Cytophagales bacterium]|nr:radical SAM protein [Cytophagales bacterium]